MKNIKNNPTFHQKTFIKGTKKKTITKGTDKYMHEEKDFFHRLALSENLLTNASSQQYKEQLDGDKMMSDLREGKCDEANQHVKQ